MENSNIEKKESFKELINQLKSGRSQTADIVSHKTQVLHRVRQFEQSQATSSQKINLAAARGEDLDRLALLDPLTDLYNHRTFVKELKAELARANRYQQSVSVCMISIDHFEELDKQYGPLTADAILKIIGNTIKHAVREVDFSGRYDGHQFILGLSKSGISGGAIVAERIRQRIGAQAISHNWENFSLTASFGVAAYPEQATEYDELIALAVNAMEHANSRGGDRVLAV